jgi:DNA-binding beta-propeller fold protein YncE
MVAAGGSLWVAGDKSVVQIDPNFNRVLATVRVPGDGPWGIAATAGAIWAALPDKGAVARVDVRSHHVSLTPVGSTPYAVSADRGAVFVTSYNSRRLSRLDPQTGRVVATTHVDDHPYWIENADGSLWVGAVGAVYRIDPRTLRTTAKIDVGQDFATLAADGHGCIWAAEGTSAEVSCIDTHLNRVSRRLRLGLREPVAIAPWGHDLWIADYGSGLIRVTP